MTTSAPFSRQNVPVTPPRRVHRALIVGLLAPALLLAGCGGADEKAAKKTEASVDLPQGNVKVPDGVELTEAGTVLDFGATATVAYEPNTQRSSVLQLTVNSVREGSLADFSGYQLDDRTKKSRPYYVRVTVKNVGAGDLSRTGVPLLAVDKTNTLIQPSSFNNSFEKCPSNPLPAGFGAGKQVQECLVYLVPNEGTLEAMSFRPVQAFEAIRWEGPIQPVQAEKQKKNKKGSKKKANP